MDLKNFESTSILAIKAVYSYFWDLIPEKYKIPEDVEKVNSLEPFYDPLLTFENRLHYKLTQVNYENRTRPWFVITWNTEKGLLNSSLNRRRYLTTIIDHKELGKIRFKFINTDLDLTLGICCNSMGALYELQENLVLKVRDKIWVDTEPHSVIGRFPVSINIVESSQSKLDRNKGTLCYLTLSIKVDYPIIGNVQRLTDGVIEEIHSFVKASPSHQVIFDDIKSHQNELPLHDSVELGDGKHRIN